MDQKNSATTKPSQNEILESSQVSTWTHRAWFSAGCAAVLFSIAKSSLLLTRTPTSSRPWFASILAALAGYVAADLGSGIYHWAIDNYGGAETPIFGRQIVGFLGHHQRPWLITKFHLANNLHSAAIPVAVIAFPICILSDNPVVLMFTGVMAVCTIFTQNFHAWVHTPKGKLPPLVVALQDAGIIVRRADHAAHHQPPFDSNYCIVSGLWNRVLDRINFFVALEMVVAAVFGYRPRSWTEFDSEQSESGLDQN